jgi:hypothetical protein
MAKMQEFTDAMCKCTDQACAQKVADGMTQWGQQMEKSDAPPKFSDAETKELTSVGERMGGCMQKAMSPGSGSKP